MEEGGGGSSSLASSKMAWGAGDRPSLDTLGYILGKAKRLLELELGVVLVEQVGERAHCELGEHAEVGRLPLSQRNIC